MLIFNSNDIEHKIKRNINIKIVKWYVCHKNFTFLTNLLVIFTNYCYLINIIKPRERRIYNFLYKQLSD